MVDVNAQNKTISVNVSSSEVSSNVNASGDTTMYYSNKAKEWAISNRIVDGVDYSSKYYANISKTNALQSAETRELLQGEYNQYSQNLSDIATTESNNAISAIQSQQTTSVNAVKTEGTTQVNLAKAQATAAANSATQASNVVKEVEEDLASKVDIDDMVQVDFVEVPTIVEVSDPSLMPSWYIVYSNGWIEQGGYSNGGGTFEAPLTVNLLKPYTNENYCVTFGIITTSSVSGFAWLRAKEKNLFKAVGSNFTNDVIPFNWRACGY